MNVNLLNPVDEIILKENIDLFIFDKFKKLNEKQLLTTIVFDVVKLLARYYYSSNFVEHFVVNNRQDVLGVITLILPYFDINKIDLIESLDQLIHYTPHLSNEIDNNFYLDHDIYELNINTYFENFKSLLEVTLFKTAYKLMPNWINIFPYCFEDYATCELAYDLKTKFLNHTFEKYNLKIQYSTLYGSIFNFLYNDIKFIKWTIYDIIDNNKTIPMIVYLSHKLNCYNYKHIDIIKKNGEFNVMNDIWNNISLNIDDLYKLRSLYIYYIHYNIHKLQNDYTIKRFINIVNYRGDKNIDELDDEFKYTDDYNEVLSQVHRIITFENIYIFLYSTFQQFKYTFYSYFCMDDDKIIRTPINYLIFIKNFMPNIENINNDLFHITPKTIYNYFKGLINRDVNGEFVLMSYSADWNELDIHTQQDIITKLNNGNWFSIKRNFKNLYKDYELSFDLNNIYEKIIKIVIKTDLIPRILFCNLCFNGILTKVEHKKELYDKKSMPDKNLNYIEYKNYMKKNVNIEPNKYYNFINNTLLKEETINVILNGNWYELYGANWLSQIQQFHHFLHNRVMFVTGQTGAGKSTVYPMVTLYAYKALNYNNNAKIYCTQPRIQPTQENAERIANQLGYPINNLSNINYVQYQHSSGFVTDDFYHPTLRFYTDGSIKQLLIDFYILKKTDENNNFTNKNLIDMLMVDESHENNVNMNVILTLVKFALYINNSVSLGIISATMKYDEKIYRKFYRIINDNYKYPIDLYIKTNNLDRNFIDRRINLSNPESGYEIIEYNNFNHNENIQYNKIINALVDIYSKKDKGDILIFQNGQNEIIELVKKINSSPNTPADVLAIPFYSNLDKSILEDVKKIDESEIRKKFCYPREYTINTLYDGKIPTSELTKKYNQFIIVATNIAEASITISSLSYVIDVGTQKINIFDIITYQNKIKEKNISKPSQLQRKGRVGRQRKGYVYYLYDINILKDKPIYKIQIENLTDFLLDLMTIYPNKIITEFNDPNIITEIKNILTCVKEQYMIDDKLYKYNTKTYITIDKIIYPFNDGKFDYEQLINNDFYIINPSWDKLTMNDYLQITKYDNDYYDKVIKTFDYLKQINIINNYNKTNAFGISIIKMRTSYETKNPIDVKDLFLLLHSFSYNRNDTLYNYLMHNSILKIVFSTINEKLPVKIKSDVIVDNEFIVKSKIINKNLYELLNIIELKNFLTKKLSSYDESTVKLIKFNGDNYYELVKSLVSKELLMNAINMFLDNNLKNVNKKEIKFHKAVLGQYFYHKIIIQNIIYNYQKFNIDEQFMDFFNTNNFGVSNREDIFNCLLILYNSQNLVERIPNTTIYINYYNRDINNLFTVNSSSKIRTPNDILLYLKNHEGEDDIDNILSELVYIKSYILGAKIIPKVIKVLNNIIDKSQLELINPIYTNKQNYNKLLAFVNNMKK